MKPGKTYLPDASITSASGGAARLRSMREMVSFSQKMSATKRSLAVMISPFLMSRDMAVRRLLNLHAPANGLERERCIQRSEAQLLVGSSQGFCLPMICAPKNSHLHFGLRYQDVLLQGFNLPIVK